MKKYAINILVILFLLTPFTLFANGCHANNDTIKVLAIGNSFSQDAVEQYLHELGEAEGITMIIGNMFIGGCSLERHVQNIRNNAPAYAYRKVEKDGEKTDVGPGRRRRRGPQPHQPDHSLPPGGGGQRKPDWIRRRHAPEGVAAGT